MNIKRDENSIPVISGVTDDANQTIQNLLVDSATGRLLVSSDTAGPPGADAFVYIAYASDSSGTNFTNTFNAALNYIAVKNTTTAIAIPVASDFTGLWKNYKGATGAIGLTPTITDTSVTSNAIGTGLKTFSVLATNGWIVGDWLVIASAANVANYMTGQITTYTGPSITVNVVQTGGSGTHTDWNIGLSGTKGLGDVIGPATNTDSYIPQWNGADSKTLKNGLAVPTGGLAGITDLASYVPYTGGTMIGALVTTDHGTATNSEVVGICYGTSATPPTANTTPIGTLYIQYQP